MPRLPAPSGDDEDSGSAASSDTSLNAKEEEPAKKPRGSLRKFKVDTPPSKEEEEDEEEEEESGSEEEGDDIYVVEAIVNHVFDEEGVLKFHVRWKDYPKLKDHTWEPEENLGSADEVLSDYITSIGGREALDRVPRPKKRGRTSMNGTPSGHEGSQKSNKKARKVAIEDAKSEDTPERTRPSLPPGNWEDLIASIDTMDRHVSGYWVLLTFKDGTRVKQPTSTVYKRCPQKMLKFYESHLSIMPATRAAGEQANIEV